MYELIKDIERDMITKYIDKYANGKLNVDIVDLPHILRYWERNKVWLNENIFHDKLILEKEVIVKKAPEQMQDEIWRELRSCDSKSSFARRFVDVIDTNYNWPERNYVESLVSDKTLAENRYSYPTISIDLPDSDKPFTLAEGCKSMKAIKRIAEAYGIEGFEEFRLLHSQILNQKTFKGTLCLSIHPLDYMTASDNQNGWSSCMSWSQYGCYRQGTVEMMNSDMVVVAYLKSSKNMNVPGGHEWNNKKWREFFIVNDELAMGIKGYPIWNHNLEKEVLKWIKELANINYGDIREISPYSDNYDEDEDSRYHFEFSTGMMYNDIENNEGPYWGILVEENFPDEYNHRNYYYSGESECMICGGPVEDYYDEDEGGEGNLTCAKCCNAEICDHCGHRIYEGEESYYVEGDYVCADCWENQANTDTFTHESYYIDNLTNVEIIDMKEHSRLYGIRSILISQDTVDDMKNNPELWKSVVNGPLYKIIEMYPWDRGYSHHYNWAVDINDLSSETVEYLSDYCDFTRAISTFKVWEKIDEPWEKLQTINLWESYIPLEDRMASDIIFN